MAKKILTERFENRVETLNIPTEEIERLWRKSHDFCKKSDVESESICIKIFEDDVVEHDGENQLWVLIRNNTLVTTWRRSEDNDKYTNSFGMNVERVSYQFC